MKKIEADRLVRLNELKLKLILENIGGVLSSLTHKGLYYQITWQRNHRGKSRRRSLDNSRLATKLRSLLS
jgi:hypothetical protein